MHVLVDDLDDVETAVCDTHIHRSIADESDVNELVEFSAK